MAVFKQTFDGRVAEVDGQGYGKIETPDGHVVHFTLSQVKTPAGANVGSISISPLLVGESVRASAKDAGDGVLIAESVVIIDGDKWLHIRGPEPASS
jgi:hypothetical protein